MRKDHEHLIKTAQKQGFRIELKRSGHYQLRSLEGAVYHTSSTPSDWRATANLRSWLRRHGLKEGR